MRQGAGSAVLAHDKQFDRWVAGDQTCFLKDEDECANQFDSLLQSNNEIIKMKTASREKHAAKFTWKQVLSEYESLLKKFS